MELTTPIAISTEETTKRNFSDTMETKEEVGISETNKRNKVEVKGDLVEIFKTRGKKNQVKIQKQIT